ncbi:MAG: flagellin [Pseudochelatococcus sp.]|jgi:flagellar hook-associated protein 3 FlgL|uniref:flagellin n=1 Tax=Pseudochelatococcus sp. TaxID=2020869 RepID=UPI003D8DC451
MAANFVSTFNLLNGPRLYARNAQAEIARLGKEMVEGRHADVGLVLGAKTGYATLLYQEVDRVGALMTSNGVTAGRLDATQAALAELYETADDMLATLVGLPSNPVSAATIKGEAERNLTALIDKLNSSFAGAKLFGGIKTDKSPMTDESASVQAAFNDFLAGEFTTYWTNLPTDVPPGLGNTAAPTISDIGEREINIFFNRPDSADLAASLPGELEAEWRAGNDWPSSDPLPADIQTEITTKTNALVALAAAVDTNDADYGFQFNDANWKGSWSSASDANIRTRISITEEIVTSVNTNADPFRQFAQAYAALGALPSSDLNEQAFKATVSYAIDQISKAMDGLMIMQADLGTAQARITTANEKLKAQETLLQQNLVTLEGVDPAEAKVASDAFELQLNLAYSLTARLQNLSLLNYL